MSDPHGGSARGRGRGRPKLGVIGREVTLLPRHWDWLNSQAGGASAALRRLIDAAQPTPCAPDPARAASPLDGFVPPDRRDDARRAVSAAFGNAGIDSARRLSGAGAGHATVVRLTVRGADHVLRLEGPRSPAHDTARHYACLAIAGKAGVAPRLRYADADRGVALTEFLEPLPAADLPPRVARIRAIVASVKRLHAAPRFPPQRTPVQCIDALLEQCRTAGILAGEAVHEHLRLYGELAAVYSHVDPDPVSSHNALHPGHIVFTRGRGRAWFVDWESAGAADRHVDLAAVANAYAVNRYDEEMVLRLYFGEHLTDRHRAHAFVMQQLNRMFQAVALLNAVAAVEPQARLTAATLATPRFGEGREEVGSPTTHAERLRFAGGLLNEMKGHLQSPRFAEARRLIVGT